MDTEVRSKQVVQVVEQLARELNPHQEPKVGPSTHLEWDLGLGSIERHELLVRLEKKLQGSLPSKAVFQASTVAELLSLTPGASTDSLRRVVNLAKGEVPPHPAHATDLLEALQYQVDNQPERETLHFLDEGEPICTWTYPDLMRECQSVAGGLLELGVRPGERIGLMLPSGPDYLASFYGIMWAGAIPVPLYPPFRMDQLEDYVQRQASILRLTEIRILISFDRAKPIIPLLKLQDTKLSKVVTVPDLQSGQTPPPRVHPHALIQFTSGSTGSPKGVVLSHGNLIHNIRGYGHGMDLNAKDVTISWLPLYHDMGLIGTMLGSVYHGQPLALMGPQDFLARPSRWLKAIHQYGGTVSPAPNFAYEICARKIPDEELEGLDLSSWRIALNGAEAVRPETLQRFTDRFAPYGFDPAAHFPAYGLAEASLAVTFPPPGRGPLVETLNREALEKRGVVASCGPGESSLQLVACGRPLPEMEVRIVTESGETLPDLVRGLVEFRGPSSMQCYYNNPEATRAIKDDDGWVKTGDLGYLSEGELYLTGRVKDIIIKAGRNIQAEDVEDMVADVEGVRRGCIACFAVDDDHDGTEHLVILAESRTKVSEEKERLSSEIEKHVTRRLGLPPDRVEIVRPGSVPKTPSGKIRRSECRKRWLAGELEPSKNVLAQVRRIVGRSVGEYLVRRPKEWVRDTWSGFCLITLILTPQAVSLVSTEMAKKMLGPLARLYLKIVGIHLDVRGVSGHPAPCVLVCNHCSTLDSLVLCAAWPTPVTFMVAPWVSRHVGLKHLISRLGHVAVHRGDPEAAARQEKEIEQKLRNGETLAVFPEGGFEITPGLRPFALGAFRLAAQAGVPVIPVALQGTRKAQPTPRRVPYKVPVMASFGPPLEAEDTRWESVLKLCKDTRSWIADHCGDPISHRRLRRND
jgi:fatty-acyl-CoA synthase